MRRALASAVLAAGMVAAFAGCSAPAEPAPAETPASTAPAGGTPAASGPTVPGDAREAIEGLESEYGARVGVSIVDTDGSPVFEYRADERFGFASTIKAFAAAALLDSTDEADREELVRWTREDVEAAGHAPATERALGTGLTLDELAEAAVRESDNAATNLVIERLGGPQGMRDALRRQGDEVTQPEAYEPELNDVVDGDPSNTSTANAFAENLSRIENGEWLGEADRAQWFEWMSGNATGDTLIRAGVPEDWAVADKSGAAGGMRNDVAVVEAPDGEPFVLVILTEKNDPEENYEDALVADVARAVTTGN